MGKTPRIPAIKRFFLLSLWLLSACVAKAQVMQSQQNSVPSKKNSIQKYVLRPYSPISAYLDSARYLANKAPLRAVEFINKAIEGSISSGDEEKEAEAYLILGDIQQNLGQHDMAIVNYKKSIAALSNKKKIRISYSEESPVTLFYARKHMASSLMELSDYDKAKEQITACINSPGSASSKELLEARRIQSDIFIRQGKTEAARDQLNDILDKEQLQKNAAGEIQTLLLLGKAWEKEGNEGNALGYYTKAKDLSEKTKQSSLTIQSNEAMAGIYRQQKQVDKEVQARYSNIALNNSINNSTANTKQNVEIGNAYLNVNQTEMASNYYDISTKQQQQLIVPEPNSKLSYSAISSAVEQQQQKPIELFSISNDLEEAAKAYKTIAEQYVKQKDLEKAAIYFEKYAHLQDSIHDIRQKELDEAIAISTNIGKNQQRIDLLEKEKELNNKSIDILKQDKLLKEEQIGQRNWVIITLCVLVALMILAVFFVIRSSREKKKIHQLLALKSLRGQMNPHFIFNALNSVNHYVSQNDERQANRYLSDFSRLMRLVMDSSKYDFIALGEELEMLRLYMQLEHARFKDKFDYDITVSEQLEDADWELPPMLIQPYLENAVWHGLRYVDGKGSLKLKLEQANGELLVTITDNGIGRKRSLELKTMNQKKQNSTGMQNISNRVQIMNEIFHTNIRVEITEAFPDQANCGTLVKLFIPKKPNTHA